MGADSIGKLVACLDGLNHIGVIGVQNASILVQVYQTLNGVIEEAKAGEGANDGV